MRNDDSEAGNAGRAASDWYVALDAAAPEAGAQDADARDAEVRDAEAREAIGNDADAHDDAAFDAWLAAPGRADALARCDAAVALAPALRHEPSVAWAFEEAARLAARPRPPARRSPWYRRPAPAWGVAAAATAVAVVSLTVRPWPSAESPPIDAPAPAGRMAAAHPAAADPDPIPSLTADAELASAEPVVLPGEVVVDARSIAVLPFAADRDAAAAVADRLYVDVVDQLMTVPGLYVVDRAHAGSYADAGLGPREIAAMLGVRGIVEGRVVEAGGRVQVELRFTDAADPSHLVREAFERPVDEVASIRADIASAVLVALASAAAARDSLPAVNEY